VCFFASKRRIHIVPYQEFPYDGNAVSVPIMVRPGIAFARILHVFHARLCSNIPAPKISFCFLVKTASFFAPEKYLE